MTPRTIRTMFIFSMPAIQADIMNLHGIYKLKLTYDGSSLTGGNDCKPSSFTNPIPRIEKALPSVNPHIYYRKNIIKKLRLKSGNLLCLKPPNSVIVKVKITTDTKYVTLNQIRFFC